jgi:ParB/RepB/Spo0J family partition protein
MTLVKSADYTAEEIPVSKITSPGNVRRQIGDTTDLEASIKSVGLIEPILVRHANGNNAYELISGHRRLAAVTNLGDKTISARVLTPTDDTDINERTRITLQLVENLQRVDLDPIEEASGYAQLKQYGWKQKDIAAGIGRSQGHVSKRLALLDLPDRAFELHDEGKVGPEALYELSRVVSAEGDISSVLDEIDKWRSFDDSPPTVQDIRLISDDAVADAKATKELDQRATELTGDGLRVVTDDPYTNLAKGEERIGYTLDVDPDDHRAEPCAVVYLWVRWGKVVEQDVCSDPGRHRGGDSKLQAKKTSQGPSAAEKKRREDQKARVKLLTTALPLAMGGRTPSRDKILDRVATLYLDNVWAEVSKRAIKLLNLEAETEGDYSKLKELYESAATEDRNQILLAVVLADGHTRSTGSYVVEGSDAIKNHVSFLADLGVDVDVKAASE